jgi:hypothetical protein
MAISKNALITAGLMTFGVSLAVAAGPYGLAFGMALLCSSMVALAMSAIMYGISEGNFNSSMRTGSTVHTSTFIPVPKPGPAVVHTQQFVPAGGVRVLPVTPVVAPVLRKHTQEFRPASTAVPTALPQTHTRHFEPAAPQTHVSRTFTPAANLARATTATVAPTIHHPSVGATSHTRTFVPRH